MAAATVAPMRGVRCQTKRSALASETEARVVAHRAHKPVRIVQCPYCRWWHVVGVGSPLIKTGATRRYY